MKDDAKTEKECLEENELGHPFVANEPSITYRTSTIQNGHTKTLRDALNLLIFTKGVKKQESA